MKSIIMSTESVKAILDGRKTMTRRVVKPQPEGAHSIYDCEPDKGIWILSCGNGGEGGIFLDWTVERKQIYSVGEDLYVKETWNGLRTGNGKMVPFHTQYWFKADDTSKNPDDKWRSSMFMPREAARIFLRIVDVRIEQLHEITSEDCIREGMLQECFMDTAHAETRAYNRFRHTWDELNAKRGYPWESNPWVWVISFDRCFSRKEIANERTKTASI